METFVGFLRSGTCGFSLIVVCGFSFSIYRSSLFVWVIEVDVWCVLFLNCMIVVFLLIYRGLYIGKEGRL